MRAPPCAHCSLPMGLCNINRTFKRAWQWSRPILIICEICGFLTLSLFLIGIFCAYFVFVALNWNVQDYRSKLNPLTAGAAYIRFFIFY